MASIMAVVRQGDDTHGRHQSAARGLAEAPILALDCLRYIRHAEARGQVDHSGRALGVECEHELRERDGRRHGRYLYQIQQCARNTDV